ncbi:MAG TPA: hypothetical protein VEK07_23460 [Polyangiaceae bacterium]|nr:hypothetical protein [Polyangiaceae bacterium]
MRSNHSCSRVRVLLSVLSVTVGCIRAPSGPSGDVSRPSTPAAVFPAPSELAPLPSLPAPKEAFELGDVPVDRWTVEGSMQFPADEQARYEDPSPWGDVARAFAAAHHDAVRLSSSLRCAALETARFYVQQRGLPTESLRRFLVARCGATTPDASVFVYGGNASDTIPDATLLDHSKAAVEEQLASQLTGTGPRVIGLAAYRAGGRFAIATLTGSDPIALEPLPRSVNDSRHVSIRGRLRAPAAEVMAVVNQGDYGVTPCWAEPAAHLPSFAFTCKLSEQDHYAWVQIAVRQNGRVLTNSVADLLIDDGTPSPLEYRSRAGLAPVPHDGDARRDLFDAINAVRTGGKLAPLILEAKQSDSDGRLVGTLLDATFKHRDGEMDRIALGMLAGWDVGATIRNGGIFVGVVSAAEAGAWIDLAVERPLGRLVLLDPAARRVAIAPAVQADGKGLGAVVTTYSLFDAVDPAADEASVLERFTALRRALGHQALDRLPAPPALDEEARRVLGGAAEPGAALYAAMQAIADESAGRRVNGYVVEGNDLDHMPVPDALLNLPSGALAVRVTHHRVKGAAWGQYVIFFVVVSGPVSTGGVQM